MTFRRIARAWLLIGLGALLGAPGSALAQQQPPSRNPQDWPVHDLSRPQPPVVAPGTAGTQEKAGRPPSDAVVLFGGDDLSAWESAGGGPAAWTVRDGYFEVNPEGGDIRTKQGFGDVQLHAEWMAPNPARGAGQDRGNSGIFFMEHYEVQVLDNYGNETYPDGQAGSLYGQYPPYVNANRPPGEWQTYDVVFRRPRFDASGRLVRPATATVFLNGVLVQDHVPLTGPTGHRSRPPYQAHADRLPIRIQDHDHPVRFRNIWVRELTEE